MAQSKSKEEIFRQMKNEMPYSIGDQIKPYILEAMEIYANQESISFANWLSYQNIGKRSIEKLLNNIEKYINPQANSLIIEKLEEAEFEANKLKKIIDDVKSNIIDKFNLNIEDYS